MDEVRTIAVIGTGNLGATLARRWRAAGHRIVIGARDPGAEKVVALVGELGGDSAAAPVADAVAAADVVVVATPGAAVPELAASLGPALAGTVVIDATNHMGGDRLHHMDAWSEQAPAALAFRAFNTLGWENFAEPDHDGGAADLLVCGPEAGRDTVEGLVHDVGLRPVWIGDADQADVLDGVTRLWFALVFGQGRDRRTAFRVLDA
ncbi:MAG: NAD(P)-binding domain-containing protein [Acidimicrobiia bacterium]